MEYSISMAVADGSGFLDHSPSAVQRRVGFDLRVEAVDVGAVAGDGCAGAGDELCEGRAVVFVVAAV